MRKIDIAHHGKDRMGNFLYLGGGVSWRKLKEQESWVSR